MIASSASVSERAWAGNARFRFTGTIVGSCRFRRAAFGAEGCLPLHLPAVAADPEQANAPLRNAELLRGKLAVACVTFTLFSGLSTS